jgi:germination protein M
VSPARRRRPRRPGEVALRRIAFAWLAGAAAVAALAGCGGGKKETTPPTVETTSFRVYFMRDGKVQPVLRTVPKTDDAAKAALDALGQGPTAAEQQDLGVTTAVTGSPTVAISSGTAHVDTSAGAAGSAQIVYTLTQYPTVRTVVIAGKTYTRKSFEDRTPQILVETPLPFQRITSPLHATGTANTFEATFQYELRDLDGKVVARHFVTATSGTGTRGTFDVTIPFRFHHPGMGAFVVYELSAEDGSRIHQVEIPVELTR